MAALLPAAGIYALTQTKFGKNLTKTAKEAVNNVISSFNNGAQQNANKRAGKKNTNINRLVKPKAGVPAGSSAMVNTTVSNGKSQQSVKLDIASILAAVDAKYRTGWDVVESHEDAIDDLSERMDAIEANLGTFIAAQEGNNARVFARAGLTDLLFGGLSQSFIKLINLDDIPSNSTFRFLAVAVEEATKYMDVQEEDKPFVSFLTTALYVLAYYDATKGLSSIFTADTTTTTTTSTTSTSTSSLVDISSL